MRYSFSLFLLLFGRLLLTAQTPITLEDIWLNDTFKVAEAPGFQFMNDNQYFVLRDNQRIVQYDVRSGKEVKELFNVEQVKEQDEDWPGDFDDFKISPDETKILLATQVKKLYRHSFYAQYWVYDLKTLTISRLYIGPAQREAVFSPDGTKVAFVAFNNLLYKDLVDGKTTRISFEEDMNNIINGMPDWVYEEEFGMLRAFEWSPDSKYLAWLRFYQGNVPNYSLEFYRDTTYPEVKSYRYPKVGEPNSDVSAWVYNLESTLKIKVNYQAEYIPRIQWSPDNRLCVSFMNRHQDTLSLQLLDPVAKTLNTLLTEGRTGYIELTEPRFLKDGSGFIWASESSGYRQLYLYGMDGQLKNELTRGSFEVTNFYGVDEKTGTVYYQADEKSPLQREVYTVNLKGKARKPLFNEPGWNEASFSSNFDYCIHTYSNINTPPVYTLVDKGGKTVNTLQNNQKLKQKIAETGVPDFKFVEIPIRNIDSPDGAGWTGMLNAWLLLPVDAEKSEQKLPLLMYVYGGPGSQSVQDKWGNKNYLWFRMLAQQGYAVACVDNRGTGGRGEAFRKVTYLNLGKYETADQIRAAEYLGTLPNIDPSRISIFGWSYGGYMSSLCMFKGGKTFASGIAVAPVAHWKWYDDIYTERYMRTYEENKKGYDAFAPVNSAKWLQGRFLLVHGLADDNVHFQNAAELANQLIANNKNFESMVYPNRDHSILDKQARLHLYRLMTRFLEAELR